MCATEKKKEKQRLLPFKPNTVVKGATVHYEERSRNRLFVTTTAVLIVFATLYGILRNIPAKVRTVADEISLSVAEKDDFTLFQALTDESPPPNLFPHTDAQRWFLPPRFLAAGLVGARPIPTNNWWGNMIAAITTLNEPVHPVWANPYMLRPAIEEAPFGLDASYPYPTRKFSGDTGNHHANKQYLYGISSDFTLSATEFQSGVQFEVIDWDDLSVQLRFALGNDSKRFEATLVSGMAFVTATYFDLQPRFSTIHAILTINQQPVLPGTYVSGIYFVIVLNNAQTWTLYFSENVALYVESMSTLVTVNSAFHGTTRLALITNPENQELFNEVRGCVVEGGDVEARDEFSYAYHWKTSGNCTKGLLHYAQIHHVETLDRETAAEVPGVSAFSTTRGKMTALLTKRNPPVWRFKDMQDIPAEFYPKRRLAADIVATYHIKETLIADIRSNWSLPLDGSYYFNGKAAQKYASLCLMANDVAVVGNDSDSLRIECVQKLERILTPFLKNQWVNELEYDTVYRGILSSQGFKTKDPNVDFGNTMYNDHHYHYGYWIVTAAIVNHLDPHWLGLQDLNRMANFLVRDVANPTRDDNFFPKFRTFDWFRGHSYSHGVTPFADGKDEESSSEDVNFHYGMALLGKVTNNTAMAEIGRLMLRVNARAVQTYFQIRDASETHPKQFRPNKVTGILFDNKVDYATWFSPEKYAIHGIQMIPVLPVTPYIRTREFVEEEWNQVLALEPIVLNDDTSNPWLSLLYVNYATVDKELALANLQITSMDDGMTRSWALYMAASR